MKFRKMAGFVCCALIGIAFVLVLVNGFALPFEGLFKLDIIHYNDFHARFEETSLITSTCRSNNASCLGGFPRLYYEITELMKEKPNALLLNAGDSFQGTYWYTLLKWDVIQQFMNLLPHNAHLALFFTHRFNKTNNSYVRLSDAITVKKNIARKPDCRVIILDAGKSPVESAMGSPPATYTKHTAIGNHEFDDGPAGLAPYLAALNAPVLAANMDTSKEPLLEGLFVPHIIVENQGRKIGIIGLITTDTKFLSNPGNVEFTDPFEATKRETLALCEKGVDIIILLSHCGLDIDKKIAEKYGQHIDVIVGGHTHSLLWNGPSPSGDTVVGPYPVIVQPSANLKHNVLIVQASSFTKYMGNLSVYFNYKGEYVKWEGGPIFLNRSIPEDEDIKAQLLPFAKQVHAAADMEVGVSKTTLHFEDCVFGECALGDMLVDSQNEYGISKVQSKYDYISFMQRGNIQSSINAGKITKGTLFELLPYNDRIISFELKGSDVRAALERSVKDAWALNPFKGPWVLQVSGIRVSYNVSLPEGQRLRTASVNGMPLEDEKYYQVTVPDYLSNGGDGFMMFKNRINPRVLGHDQAVVSNYIGRHSPLDVESDGRIQILY